MYVGMYVCMYVCMCIIYCAYLEQFEYTLGVPSPKTGDKRQQSTSESDGM